MGLESAFDAHFQVANHRALSTGLRGAYFEGCGRGVANGLIYGAEALLFYTGAVLISKGIYTYLQMVQVLNLVVFTVTIGSQLMVFSASFVSLAHRLLLMRRSSRTDRQGFKGDAGLEPAGQAFQKH